MQDRELRKVQQESLFDNLLSIELLNKNKTDALKVQLKVANKRLKSGMSPDEIEATEARAKEACADISH